ncbi:SNF1-interacting protein [Geranomyces variabilis]|nr:SNF1-interacting protein [Geranomyces variabilis]
MGNSPAKHSPEHHSSTGGGASSSAPKLPQTVNLGHLVPSPDSVYKNTPQDWDHDVVGKLITEHRMAPFYVGLAEYDENDYEAAAAVASSVRAKSGLTTTDSTLSGSPATSPSPSPSDAASQPRRIGAERTPSFPSQHPPPSLRAKRSQSMPSQLHRNESGTQITPENLYRYALECPICFLYYPANINYSRCCDQPICTECFVQIKRSDATLEPASCPFCVETNFGILYHAPGSAEYQMKLIQAHPEAFTSVSENNLASPVAAQMSASLPKESGLPSPSSDDGSGSLAVPPQPAPFKRRQSVSHQSALVVTSDDLRPNWLRKQQQLAAIRAANQRRNTLPINAHAAAVRRTRQLYLESDSRDLAGAASAAAALVEGMSQSHPGGGRHMFGGLPRAGRGSRAPRQSDLGPNYLEAMRNMGADLEELMMMEAIRRSLQAEANPEAAEPAATASSSPPATTPAAVSPRTEESTSPVQPPSVPSSSGSVHVPPTS